jgi:hypothetical protein
MVSYVSQKKAAMQLKIAIYLVPLKLLIIFKNLCMQTEGGERIAELSRVEVSLEQSLVASNSPRRG